MPSEDLIQMMLLDGSFLIELLRYLSRDEIPKVDDDPILFQPCVIPVLTRDVLKLENQLPLFVLTSLFRQCDEKFMKLALEFFNLSWTGPRMTLPSELHNCSHLLDLFYWSLVKPLPVKRGGVASTHSMRCTKILKRSGIKFVQRKTAETFLDIKFKSRVLQIPGIAFDNMMQTALINCVALEQSRECHIKYFCNYVSFFSCLICRPSDVSSLSLDGIISKFSDDDRYVADFFKYLRGNMKCVRHSYLSDEIKNVKAYYYSDKASLRGNCFATKWTALKVLAISLLLVLAIIQTLMSVLIYLRGSK